MILDASELAPQIEALKTRTHNLPKELQEEALGELISDDFDRKTAKCAKYLFGNQIFTHNQTRGYFDTLSLGNWLIIAEKCGVRSVPARYLSAAPALALFSDGMGNKRPDHFVAELEKMDQAIQTIKPSEMLRFDGCATQYAKAKISEGKPELTGECRGYIENEKGGVDHILCERLVSSFLNSTQPFVIAWARPIIKPSLREGYSIITGKEGFWPAEWRVYCRNGNVVGVSNYYPQSIATESDIPMAKLAAANTQKMADELTKIKSSPHHPRYEDRVDTESLHFTADFIEDEDGNLLFLEGGPDHFFSPHWGAHPCCFNPNIGIEGLALSQQDIRKWPTNTI